MSHMPKGGGAVAGFESLCPSAPCVTRSTFVSWALTLYRSSKSQCKQNRLRKGSYSCVAALPCFASCWCQRASEVETFLSSTTMLPMDLHCLTSWNLLRPQLCLLFLPQLQLVCVMKHFLCCNQNLLTWCHQQGRLIILPVSTCTSRDASFPPKGK